MADTKLLVQFAYGLQAGYDAIQQKDLNTIYFCTDSGRLFKGDIEFSRPVQHGAALPSDFLPPNSTFVLEATGYRDLYYSKDGASWEKIGRVYDNIQIGTQGEATARTLAFGDTFKVVNLTVDAHGFVTAANAVELTLPAAPEQVDISGKADKVANATEGNLAGLDANGNLADSGVAASAVALKSDLAQYTIVKDADAGDYAAVYHLTKDGVNVGAAINIPKDMVVKSGSVVDDKIILVLNDEAGTEIQIPVGDLIEYVTSGSQTGDMVVVTVSDDHKVTATITDGTVTLAKLAADVQAKINKAHEHLNGDVLDSINEDKVTAWDAAEANAIAAAASDATTKADAAQAAAEATAAADATAKANAAKAAAEATAAADATAKANTAESNAKAYADNKIAAAALAWQSF